MFLNIQSSIPAFDTPTSDIRPWKPPEFGINPRLAKNLPHTPQLCKGTRNLCDPNLAYPRANPNQPLILKGARLGHAAIILATHFSPRTFQLFSSHLP